MKRVSRRNFMRGALPVAFALKARALPGTLGMAAALQAPAPLRILDAHIHLFDPSRPGGVPWPLRTDPIYRPALPDVYASLAVPLGVVGAIAVEASPLASDNDWLLRTVKSSPLMVGMIGDLPTTNANFGTEMERLHRDPLFLGIRQGNLWNRNLADDLRNPQSWEALSLLQQANLVFESANPDAILLRAVLRVALRLPKLTIVIDHLPHMEWPSTAAERSSLEKNLRELAASHKVFIKLSEIPRRRNGRFVEDVGEYRDQIDMLWDLFGPERIIFGSDWPNSDHIVPLPETFGLVLRYLRLKPEEDRMKVLFSNSRKAYAWQNRQ